MSKLKLIISLIVISFFVCILLRIIWPDLVNHFWIDTIVKTILISGITTIVLFVIQKK